MIQQLREVFAYQSGTRFLIFDRDREYGFETSIAACLLNMESLRASFEIPWQNGVAEQWIESCRRDLLDHVIAFNELHLKRVLPECVRHYHGDRTHLGLNKETHERRAHSRDRGEVVAFPRLSGSHYRYERAA